MVFQIKNTLRHIVAFHAHLLCFDIEDTEKWRAIPSKRRYHIDDFAGKFAQNVIGTVREYKTGNEADTLCVTGCRTAISGEFEETIRKLMPATSKKFAQYALIDRPIELGKRAVIIRPVLAGLMGIDC